MTTYTLKGFLDLLGTEGINSKGKVIEALRNASSEDLIGFRNNLNKHIAIKIMKERKGE